MTLPLLGQLVAETSNPDNVHSIIAKHIRPTTIEYIELVNAVYPVDLIVAVSYSVDLATVGALRDRGYNVHVPRDLDEMLGTLWQTVLRRVSDGENPVVIQEVGGYLADHTADLAATGRVRGSVEDTAHGHWRYQEAARRAALSLPVMSIADTPLKHVEDVLVGDAVVYSLEKVLRGQMERALSGTRCGVVGWGHVGKSAAAALQGRHAIVSVSDSDPVTAMLAHVQGFDPRPLAHLLSTVDVVVGCSGRCSVTAADVPSMKDGLILCSGSSKDVEFDLVGFRALCDVTRLDGPCPVEQYTVRTTGRCFYLLDHGTPIDFLDNPLQPPMLDCTYAQLFACMRELAAGDRPAGLTSLSPHWQSALAKRWLPLYVPAYGR